MEDVWWPKRLTIFRKNKDLVRPNTGLLVIVMNLLIRPKNLVRPNRGLIGVRPHRGL